MFILASFVCNSLQCLISALTQGVKVVTYLGSLVQFCCGEGGILQTNTTGMCGESLQWMDHTGFSQAHGGVCFPCLHCSGSRLLLRRTGPVIPRSKLLRFGFSGTPQSHRLGCTCVLCPSQVPAAQATRCLASALSQVGHASLLPTGSRPLSFLGAP